VAGPGETVTTSNGKSVGFQGCAANADGSTTCTYQVTEIDGGQDLSNWVLGTNCQVVGGSPRYETVNPDPNAGITGAKWETGDGFSSGSFSVTVRGNVRLGVVSFATKAPGVALGQISGPVCQ
jgi:transcription elongation factor